MKPKYIFIFIILFYLICFNSLFAREFDFKEFHNHILNYPALLKKFIIDTEGNIHASCITLPVKKDNIYFSGGTLIYIKFDKDYNILFEHTLSGSGGGCDIIDINNKNEAIIFWEGLFSTKYLKMYDRDGNLIKYHRFNGDLFCYTFDENDNLLLLNTGHRKEYIEISRDGYIIKEFKQDVSTKKIFGCRCILLNPDSILVISNQSYNEVNQFKTHKNWYDTNKLMYYIFNRNNFELTYPQYIDIKKTATFKISNINIPLSYFQNSSKHYLEILKYTDGILLLTKPVNSKEIYLIQFNNRGELINSKLKMQFKELNFSDFFIKKTPVRFFITNQQEGIPINDVYLFGISEDLNIFFKEYQSFKQDPFLIRKLVR